MAIQMIENSWCGCADAYRKEFILDSAAEAANLPECAPGSVAIVAAKDGPMYMVNASGEWVEV